MAGTNDTKTLDQEQRESSRRRLLRTAGEVFAEKGSDRATAKEICSRAGVNPAAVNYYFGSKEGLYEAVLQEAHRAFLDLETLAASIPGQAAPQRKLEAFLKLVVTRIFATPRQSWHLRLIAREMAMPTVAFAQLVEKEIKPKSMYLRAIVAELLQRPIDDVAVSFCTMSVISQMLSAFQNLAAFSAILPCIGEIAGKVGDSGENEAAARHFAEVMSKHIYEFSLGGVERIRNSL